MDIVTVMARGWSERKAQERKAPRRLPSMLLGLNRSQKLEGLVGNYNGRSIKTRLVTLPARVSIVKESNVAWPKL